MYKQYDEKNEYADVGDIVVAKQIKPKADICQVQYKLIQDCIPSLPLCDVINAREAHQKSV